MPSTKKRINLTVPDELYNRLQAYKQKNGIEGDASACLQLIVQQLNGLDQTQAMFDLVKQCSVDQLLSLSQSGLVDLKKVLDQDK